MNQGQPPGYTHNRILLQRLARYPLLTPESLECDDVGGNGQIGREGSEASEGGHFKRKLVPLPARQNNEEVGTGGFIITYIIIYIYINIYIYIYNCKGNSRLFYDGDI